MEILSFVKYESFILLVSFLFFLDWIFFLPFVRAGFSRHEASGYSERDSFRLVAIFLTWLTAIGALAFGGPILRVCGAAFLSIYFRKFFILGRWQNVRRGFGAPGFMANWTARSILLIELFRCLGPEVSRLLFVTLRWDFAWIMICAGFYKMLVGYLHNNGMELGRVNPIWGYHWRFFKNKSPSGWYPVLLNRIACLVEFSGGILMLIPAVETQLIGAVAISFSFLYVSLFIRLGRLSILMSVLPLLYWPSIMNTALTSAPAFTVAAPQWVLVAVEIVLWSYIVILPAIKVMQYSNLFLNGTFPEPIQTLLARFANWVPVIMWRVFTPDVTDFFCYVDGCDESGRTIEPIIDEVTYSMRGWAKPIFKLRMLHVTESIAVTSVFTTLRYFPSRPEWFNDKLYRYSRSLLMDWGRQYPVLRYRYYRIGKDKKNFTFSKMGEVLIDMTTRNVRQENMAPGFDFSQTAPRSPVRESRSVGSFTPKTT